MKKASLVLFLLAGLAVTLLLAVGVSPFADSSPDGLERVAIDEGFDRTARDHDLAGSPLADYSVKGVEGRVSTGLAGVIGVAVTLGAGVGMFVVIRRIRRQPDPAATA